MASWKKVIVSGSTANLAALQVDNLTSGQVVIGGGTAGNLTTTAINGTGNIVATTGATSLVHSGSFSGSFAGALTGTASWATNATTATQVGSNLTQGTGITAFTYNGASAQTVSVSGSSGLSTNAVTKWTGTAFANSSLTDNGTTITGTTSIQLTGASSILSGSFSGSFRGDGSSLTGVTATPTFPTTTKTNIVSTDKFFINDDAGNATSGNKQITYSDLLIDLAGTNLAVESSDSLTLATTITGITSISSTSFTGSLLGTATTASYVASSNVYGPNGANSILSSSFALTASYAANGGTLLNSLTFGTGLSGNAATFNGSAAVTVAISGSAALTTNLIPKWTGTGLANSNITDTGTQIQIGSGASSGVTVAAGGINVTGNSTFQNNLTVTGDLTVAGTASFVNTDNLTIKDKFILINSGSSTLADSGWVTQYNAAGSGSAFYLEAGAAGDHGSYGRFAVAFDVIGTSTALTPSEYVVTAKINQAAAPSSAPTWGSANGTGNLWVTNTGDIYIYS